jgi:hypothetical protein
MRGELSKLAAKVLAKEIKRQVIAKQRGWLWAESNDSERQVRVQET